MTTERAMLDRVNGQRTKVGLDDVVRAVAREFSVTESEITARFRRRGWRKREPLATARLVAMVLALEFVDYKTRTELSFRLNRSVGMPLYAASRVKGLEQTEQWFAFKLSRLRARLDRGTQAAGPGQRGPSGRGGNC